MKNITLKEVKNTRDKTEFRNLSKRLYKGNRSWVTPLDNDIEKVFDPKKNLLFSDGEAIRWIAIDQEGNTVGRIAAFYNNELANTNEQPTGGCGFFECENDQDIANLLFDTAKQWLIEHKMEAMDGPINFGNRDEWWGLLVEGYEFQPLYGNNYHHPYYKAFFEDYGFKNYFNQHTYIRNVTSGDCGQAVYDRVKRFENAPEYRFEHIRKNNLEQVAEDFRIVYNKAWAVFTGVKPIDRELTKKILNQLKPIMDEKLIYFAYFNDEPIGFFVMIPDLNRVIAPFNGKLNLINKLRILWDIKFTKKANRIIGIIFGVVPEFHGKGIESGMMNSFEKEMEKGTIKYKSLELSWIGDFNPVMMRVVESYVRAKRHKMHTTYRLLFDPNKEFKRAPRMGAKRVKEMHDQ